MLQISRSTLRLTHLLTPPFPHTLSTLHHLLHTHLSPPTNEPLCNYLINTLKFQESKALAFSTRFSTTQTLQKPQSVLKYLKSLGFTNAQIISSAHMCPQILFASVETTLKPKVSLLEQELGLSGTTLCMLISNNSEILKRSFTKLKPVIDVVKNILHKKKGCNENGGDDLVRVLTRCSYLMFGKDSHKKLLANVSLLESCGVVDSQLANLLIGAPRIFSLSESKLRRLVSRVSDLGLTCDSRLFVHGLQTMHSISEETCYKKFKLFRSFGFTQDECREMFRKHPNVFRVSEDKLRVGLHFFVETLMMERSVFIRYAYLAGLSMENRVLARYRVMKLLESKRILKKAPQFPSVLHLSETAFFEKYILRFPAHQEDLMFQYRLRN